MLYAVFKYFQWIMENDDIPSDSMVFLVLRIKYQRELLLVCTYRNALVFT